MPFDPDKYLNEKLGGISDKVSGNGFDPEAYLKSKAGQDTPQELPGYGESALRGGAQGLSLGFADELAGAGGAGIDAIKKSSVSDVVKDYIAHRDQYRKADAAAAGANPKTYYGSQIGAGLATAAIPGLNIGRAATLGGRMAGAGALGAAASLGSSNADLTKGEYLPAGISMAKGAAIGAALTPAIEKAAAGVGNLLSGRTAETYAVRHLRPTPQTAQAMGPKALHEMGREALDSGAIGFGNKVGQTAENLGNLTEEVGALKGDIVNASTAKIDPVQVADKFTKEVIEPMQQTAEGTAAAEALIKKRDAFLAKYAPGHEYGVPQEGSGFSMTPAQSEAEKTAVQQGTNYLATSSKAKLAQQGMKGWGSTLRKVGEEAITDPNFVPVKQSYANLKAAQAIAERSAGLTDGGTGLMGHIADVGIGTEALHLAATGHPTGIALGAGRALTRGRMSSAAAGTADAISDTAQSVKQSLDANKITNALMNTPGAEQFAGAIKAAASRGQGSLAATHFLLGQTSPEYQKAMQGE